MTKYRAKPYIVEATQWKGDGTPQVLLDYGVNEFFLEVDEWIVLDEDILSFYTPEDFDKRFEEVTE